MNKVFLLAWLFLAGLVSPAFGAWSVVNHVCAFGGNGIALTSGAINTTGANLLVLYVSSYIGRSPAVITDSASNTWHTLTNPASVAQAFLAYAYNANSNASHTFTATQAADLFNAAFCVVALNGALAVSDPFDQQSAADNVATTTMTAGSLTPTLANEIVISGVATGDQGAALTIGGGFTIADQTNNNGTLTAGIAYLIQTTATASNPTWTTELSNGVTGQASFKILTGGAATTRRTVVGIQ